MTTVRVFIAVDISLEAKAVLEAVVGRLQSQGLSVVRWVRPEGIHLTLKFLGNIDLAHVDTIREAIENASRGTNPFTLSLSGIGAFPSPTSPRVIWAGLKGDLDHLRQLQERIDQEVFAAVGFPRESRGFTPHLTLGRLRDNVAVLERRRVGGAMSEVTLDAEVEWRVTEVNLIRSTLTHSGAIYDVMYTRMLKAG